METITKSEALMRHEELLERIMSGEVFIHPTDTIYGLGCNASLNKAVKKIRQMKERPDSPLSIWVPNVEWIEEFCELNAEAREWLEKLPGPYTLILKLKKKHHLAAQVNLGRTTVGVRLPDHWFSEFVHKLGVPVITTSANKAGQNFMTSLETLDADIAKSVSFTIYEGEKMGRPSKIVDLTDGQTSIKKR